jgi:hypothetical protein
LNDYFSRKGLYKNRWALFCVLEILISFENTILIEKIQNRENRVKNYSGKIGETYEEGVYK